MNEQERNELKGKYIHAESLMKWLEEKEGSGEFGHDGCHALLKTEIALLLMPGAEVEVVGQSGELEPNELNEILKKNDEEYAEYEKKTNVKLPEEKRKNVFKTLALVLLGLDFTALAIMNSSVLNYSNKSLYTILSVVFPLIVMLLGVLASKESKKEKVIREKIKEELDQEDN